MTLEDESIENREGWDLGLELHLFARDYAGVIRDSVEGLSKEEIQAYIDGMTTIYPI
jgi:hypothetical protein